MEVYRIMRGIDRMRSGKPFSTVEVLQVGGMGCGEMVWR